jgi:hypothetical protein
MEKIFLKTLLLFFPFIVSIITCIVIDPFNVFHYKNIRDNGVSPNDRYIKMRYILDNPDKFDSFLFGSSRVGGINVESITQANYYNMTYPSGLPQNHFENIEVMIKKNIVPQTVLMGIDDIVCRYIPEQLNKEMHRIAYPSKAVQNKLAYLGFLIKYLNPVVLQSLPIIRRYKGNNIIYRKIFYENGSWHIFENATNPFECNWENAKGDTSPYNYGIDNAIKDIQSIIDLCNQHNIKLIIFTNPLHKLTYQQAVEYGYIDFLARLSEMTDFYNFSGINDVTTNNDYYRETSHYKLTAGDLIIDAIFNNRTDSKLLSQGFGLYVTSENRAEFIDLLKSQLINQP